MSDTASADAGTDPATPIIRSERSRSRPLTAAETREALAATSDKLGRIDSK
jgi:hypothetical protein